MGYLNPFKQPYFFMSGERTLLGRRIIVSNGVGCSLLPLRVFAPPQLHFITVS
jgi:predicted MPP superfamily phosphohydrolase